ncbi:MAG: hypothetical protein C4305_04175 [Thermoleophilia bacterium]
MERPRARRSLRITSPTRGRASFPLNGRKTDLAPIFCRLVVAIEPARYRAHGLQTSEISVRVTTFCSKRWTTASEGGSRETQNDRHRRRSDRWCRPGGGNRVVSGTGACRLGIEILRLRAPHRHGASFHRGSGCLRSQPRPRGEAGCRPPERRAPASWVGWAGIGAPGRLRGRPDPGQRLGRGGHQAREVGQGQRHHRRDGVQRHHPHGPVGDYPQQGCPDLPHLQRAPDLDDQGQRLPLADVPLQGKVLGQAALQAFGKGATVNVGARNDAFGTALKQLFVSQWKKLGGKIGVNIAWNPDQASFDTEAQKLVAGNPAGWVIIDFPDTFEKFLPSLVRTGKWEARRTLVTEALRNSDVLSKLGDPVIGLRGTAASAAGGPAGRAFATLWKQKVRGAKPYTGFEGTAFDAAMVAFLAAVKACSSSPAKIKANLRAVSGPPGTKVTFKQLDKAVKLLLAGKDVDYEGAFSPVDFDRNGDIGSAVFEIWQYAGGATIKTLKTVTFRG